MFLDVKTTVFTASTPSIHVASNHKKQYLYMWKHDDTQCPLRDLSSWHHLLHPCVKIPNDLYVRSDVRQRSMSPPVYSAVVCCLLMRQQNQASQHTRTGRPRSTHKHGQGTRQDNTRHRKHESSSLCDRLTHLAMSFPRSPAEVVTLRFHGKRAL